jgi:hypothetical protein
MQLITMAHPGEAQGVIETFNLIRKGQDLFLNEEIVLVITGEGPFEAATKTALLIHQYPISKIINLGIAGSLNPDLAIGSIHEVRTIYLVQDLKPQFKTFQTSSTGLDCLTSFERILDSAKAQKLKGIGELIDREAWGVAMTAKTAGIPFVSYKIISDYAGTLDACELVQEKAASLSQALAEHLKTLLNTTQSEATPLQIKGFYFTFSSEHKFKTLLTKLCIKENLSEEEILTSLPLNEWREQKLMPKERTKRLLEKMEERIDPTKVMLESQKRTWSKSFESQGFKVQTDSNWENPEVSITLSASSNEDFKNKVKALSTLSLEPYLKLMNGDFHVE